MAAKILTLNVNGLNNATKRRNIMKYCVSKNCDAFLLQETHCCEENIEKWSTEWQNITRGKSLWNNGTHRERGVAILFKNNVAVSDITKDKCGRILAATICLEETSIRIINIYGPNDPQQKENFLKSIEHHARKCDIFILSGDFNMVENPPLDRQGGDLYNKNNTLGQNSLKNFNEKYELIDIYRKLNPLKQEFTFEKPDKSYKSRIDRIYISGNVAEECECGVLENRLSDHSAFFCKIKITNKNAKGPGYWHLNTSIINDIVFKQNIARDFEDSKNNKDSYENKNQWWDITKNKIKEFAIERAKELKAEKRILIENLEREIETEKLKCQQNSEKIKTLKKEVSDLRCDGGVFVRTKQQIVEEGEIPSKALFQMEKNNQTKKTIKEIASGNVLHSDTISILKTIRKFYKNLYKKREHCEEKREYFLNKISKRLSDDENAFLNIKFSSEELRNAANSLSKGKTPGIDGLPVEFYQEYWDIYGEELTTLANENFFDTKNQMSWTQRTALISLLPKEGDLKLIQNWRPISLLCADYKIFTKALALRLAKILDKILEPSQTCSVPERQIFSNIFLTREIIEYTNNKNIESFLLTIDQEKAFDKIDRKYLFKALERFNLGKNFVMAIKQTMKNTQSLIFNNGYMSKPFKIKRGVRQGDPISLMLYCLAVESLSLEIKQNKNIEGIPIPGTKNSLKVMQYADDTAIFARSLESITELFKILDNFELATGSNINKTKTKGLALGGFDYAAYESYTKQNNQKNYNINWCNQNGIKILGINFYTDLGVTAATNWQKAVEKFKTKLKSFKYRNVSLRCKSIYVNTLALSKVWFVANFFPASKTTEKEIKKQISVYLWQSDYAEPVKRKILNLPASKGGLGILDVTQQCLALRTKHILQIQEREHPHESVFFQKYLLALSLSSLAANKHPQWLFLTKNDFPKTLNSPPFYYKDVVDNLKNNLPILDLKPKTTKNIYLHLTNAHNNRDIELTERKWNATFQKILPWKRIWECSFNSYAQGPSQNTSWRLLHDSLPTLEKLKNWKKNRGRGDMLCKTCNLTENTLHPFLFCKKARTVWKSFKKLYETLIPEKNFNAVHAIFYKNIEDLSKNDLKAKLVTTITNTIITELWRSRNMRLKENKSETAAKVIENIKREIKYICKMKYNKYERENEVEKFHKTFSINNALIHANNPSLVFTF